MLLKSWCCCYQTLHPNFRGPVEANSGGFLEDSSGWLVLCMYLKMVGQKYFGVENCQTLDKNV